MASLQKVQTICPKQTTNIFSSPQTILDLWYSALGYVRSTDLQRDISIDPIANTAQKYARAHRSHRLRLSAHVNDKTS